MREMCRNYWRNATHWACLTGSFNAFKLFVPSWALTVDNALLLLYPRLLSNSIATLAVAQNMRELYRLVLVDTPLAPYFSECITSEVQSGPPFFHL